MRVCACVCAYVCVGVYMCVCMHMDLHVAPTSSTVRPTVQSLRIQTGTGGRAPSFPFAPLPPPLPPLLAAAVVALSLVACLPERVNGRPEGCVEGKWNCTRMWEGKGSEGGGGGEEKEKNDENDEEEEEVEEVVLVLAGGG